MASPISNYHKFETYKTLFDKSNGKFQTSKFFYHLALSEDMSNNNTKTQEKNNIGTGGSYFLRSCYRNYDFSCCYRKNCIMVTRLIII